MPVLVPMPRPTPIYMLGDSHVFALSDRLFRTSWGELVEFRALYHRELRTRDFVRPSGALNERVQAALRVARIGPKRWVLTENEDGHRSSVGTGEWPGIRALEDRAADPALVIATGGLDFGETAAAIAEPDLDLPIEIRDDPHTPQMCRTAAPGALPAAEAARRFAEPLEPLRALLRMFRAGGMMRVAVLGHPPMSLDEEDVDRNYRSAGFPPAPRSSMPAWRYKTLLLTNAALRRICREEGFPYIDRWAELTHDGLVRDGVLRDFVHLSDEAAAKTAAALVDALLPEPIPDASRAPSAAMRDRYDADYYRNECGGNVQYALFGGRKLEEPRLAAVYALAAVQRGARVLDIGCGRGELSYAFAKDGARVTALDYSADAIALTRTTLGDLPAHLVCADASAFHDPAGYDVAVAAMALEHFEHDEIRRLYRKVAAMVRPAGTLIVHDVKNGRPPDAQQQLLREAFEHVLVWVASHDDPRGTLARPFTAAELRDATDIFAIASHVPIDLERVLARITMEPIVADQDAVSLEAASAPQRVHASEPFVAEVVLRNDGAVPLTSFGPNPVRFAYAWSSGAGIADYTDAFSDALGRSRIEPAAKPGTAQRYGLSVVAPAEPGRHVLRVTLLQEMVRWFDVEVRIAVDVASPDATSADDTDRTRVCIAAASMV